MWQLFSQSGAQGHGHVWVQGRSSVKTSPALQQLHRHGELWPREAIISRFQFTWLPSSLVATNFLPERVELPSLGAAVSRLSRGREEVGGEKTRASEKDLPTYPHDLGVALGTDRGKELLIAPLAVHIALLLHEAHVCQGGLAVGAVELLWVPGTAHGYQEGAPGKQRTAPTKEAPKACGQVV